MPAPPPTLTERQLLVTLLDRQLLLDRARLSVPATLERMGGLQAQYAPSSYIGLWSRIDGFTRDQLDAALEQRRVVQGTLMRSTIHLVSRPDYWPLAAAVRQSRRDLWLRTRKDHDAAAMDALITELRSHLRATEGPHRAKDIEAAIGAPIMAGNQWTDLVRVPPSGTWDRRRADLYALAEDWIDPVDVTVEDGTELAVRRYLGAFGPASVANIANWAGVAVTQVRATVEAMGTKLRRYRSADGEELFDLARARIADPETPLPPRFLGVFDAITLVHVRRTGVLPEEHRATLFNTKNPQSFHTFLIDGHVAGTWKHTGTDVEITPFGKLTKAQRAALDDEAAGLDALHR